MRTGPPTTPRLASCGIVVCSYHRRQLANTAMAKTATELAVAVFAPSSVSARLTIFASQRRKAALMHASARLPWELCQQRSFRAAKRARKRAWYTRGHLHAHRCGPQPWYKPCTPARAKRARCPRGMARGVRGPAAAQQAKSSGSALRRLRRRFLPVARAAPPHTRATGQVSREGPAAHLQPPVRARGSTSQVATAKLWCRSRGATKLVVSAPPQGIASQAADLVLPATPKGGASAPAPEVVTGSVLLRHVQEARREQKEYTRLPGASRSATFW